jgi:hypothetical protein
MTYIEQPMACGHRSCYNCLVSTGDWTLARKVEDSTCVRTSSDAKLLLLLKKVWNDLKNILNSFSWKFDGQIFLEEKKVVELDYNV